MQYKEKCRGEWKEGEVKNSGSGGLPFDQLVPR